MSPDELINQVESAERVERIKRQLPPDHVLDWSEYPFAFARGALEEFRTAALSVPTAHFFHAVAYAAFQDFDAANAAMERWVTDTPESKMRFGLKPSLAEAFPDVSGSYPTESAYFLCCDGTYFRNFGIVLLRSIADHSPGLRVHIHLMNPDESLLRFVDPLQLKVSVTTERCPQRSAYYHAARFVRFSEALENCEGSLVMTDTDALATARVEVSGPLALRVRAGRLLPWNQFSACYVRGDTTSRPYFRLVSDIVRSMPLWWGIDQYALYSAWISLKPQVQLVGPEIASVIDTTPGAFWFTASDAKKRLLSDTTPYAKLFQHYIAQS